MTNYIQKGEVLTLTAPYTVASGAGALVGSLFGVATADITSGASGEFQMTGVVQLNKNTSNAATAGYPAFWDNSAKEITPLANGTVPVGFFTEAQLAADTTAKVLLTPMAARKVSISTEITGNGSAQNFAHGLGVVPSFVVVVPTDTAPATTGAYTVTEGTHTSTNAVVTVTSGKKYKVLAFA